MRLFYIAPVSIILSIIYFLKYFDSSHVGNQAVKLLSLQLTTISDMPEIQLIVQGASGSGD